MKTISFCNNISIQAPAKDIYSYLLEPNNLPHLHPLIIDVKLLQNQSSHSTRVEIQDKIMLFDFIPLYKKYEASFTSIKLNHQLLMETFTSPKIHIKNTITLYESDFETVVEEKVLVDVPMWIARFVIKQIKYSHGEMLNSLKKTLESSYS